MFLIVVVFGLAACKGGGGFSERQAARQADTFRYPIITTPTSFDPGNVQDGDTLDLLQQIYEGLVTWDTNSRVTGAIAESWESADGIVWTFHLKEGVTFHNGREVEASDVKWSIERACRPGVQSVTIDAYLSDIVGLSECADPDNPINEVSGIQVIDKYTLQITLKQKTPYFLGKLTYLVSAVLPKEAVPLNGKISTLDQMVGTGPYRIIKYEPDLRVVLERYEGYHGGPAKTKTIERLIIKDAIARLNVYKQGEVDMTMLARQDIAGLMGTEWEKDLKYFDRPAIWYVGLSPANYKPFEDVRVRQAFALAIDKKKIVNEYLGGVNTVANGIVPPGVPGHRPDAPAFEYDPERARALLAAAGYPGGRGMPPLELNYREMRPDVRIVGEAVQSMVSEVLGVEITIRTLEWGAYLEKYNRRELSFFHMRWAADFLDPQNFLSHMLATWGPENKIGYSSSAFDALCRRADTLMDMDERIPLYQQAEDVVLNDAVWIPIYFQRDVELHRSNLSGLRESLFGHLPHTTVVVDR